MKPTFKPIILSTKFDANGFDETVDPHWAMVPLGKEKFVALFDAEGMTVTPANPAIVEIGKEAKSAGKSNGRGISLKGKKEGTTFIEVKKNGVVQARLEVDVLANKTVGLAFNFLKDIAKHNTKRSVSLINDLIKDLNEIYLPQTNINFVNLLQQTVTVNRNLGNEVNVPKDLYKGTIKTGREEWDAITALGNPTAYINIFFVWKFEIDENIVCKVKCGDVIGYHAFKNVMVEDKVKMNRLSMTVAHEIGHALSVIDHSPTADLLMYASINGGTRIAKLEALQMNRSVK